ncbi:L,D-transpeptidase [Bifidobacterium vansinderenii]|uniref:Peptidoglycan-binding protein n=1 Tax=Bifidobacterium vansinderenii TaxID=1984871 RepID=A0A229VX59_9BIFI|nr:L,D-transpeptidase [Bifidobacterium vansinderenii]OXN00205.1 peptidoglycan-binding protein [Bifidobacterium vansinderenii]
MTDDKDFGYTGSAGDSAFDFPTAAAPSPDEAQTVTMMPLGNPGVSTASGDSAAASTVAFTPLNFGSAPAPAATASGTAAAAISTPLTPSNGGVVPPTFDNGSTAFASADDPDDAVIAVKRKKPVALIVVLSILAALVVLFAGYVFGGQYYFSDKAAPGVSIGGVSVMGQNASELKTTVNNAVKNSSVKVTTENGASTTASLADLGVTVDVDKTVDNLLAATKSNVLSTVNPLSKSDVSLVTTTDKLAMSTYLSDKLIGDDARVINANVEYNADSNQFVATESRDGESPTIDGVVKAVNALAAEPGTTKAVTISTETVAAPISDETAATAAADANKRIDSDIVISNGASKSFTIPSSEIAKWIKTTGDPTKGTIELTYDENAIKSYLAGTLPDKLKQDAVTEENVVNSKGTVITTSVKGVDGVEVTGTDNTAAQVLTALQNGTGSEIKAEVKTTQHETKSRQVNYDVENGDPHMVINLSEQKAYAYNGTTLVKTFNVSTGKTSTPTDTGTFFATLKYQTQTMRGEDYVTPNVQWVTYYNGGEGFHAAPWNVAGIASGTPKSHGCTNMNPDDAKWVYDFLPIGGMVEVVGSTPSSAVR